MATVRRIGAGKVRDIYDLGDDRLLLVASDRISAYDIVLPDQIPDKGRVLTAISRYFFDLLDTPHHYLSTDVSEFGLPESDWPADPSFFAGRSMVVRKAEVVPVECVVRGYLYGSSWREYQAGGGPSTEQLPPGLRLADRLAEPIFTPSTKATEGHDENLDEAGARKLIGDDLYEELKARSLEIYHKAAEHSADRGVILADTKFEFGHFGGELILIDEVLTPDSSRYWPRDEWKPGSDVPSFDKQYVRDWLDQAQWDHHPPAPHLPPEVIEGTRDRYIEAHDRITDSKFSDYVAEHS
ncbi:MAG: phosphoribosylaminoimidazolesuccinocarboxamide synthase [Actinobacteria bacterium]|nr:phosphoribosylaminoimidazolesuccinocarboxamide synthase [Actinomycetota bacterium]